MRLRYCTQLCGNVQGHLQLPSSEQLFDIAFVIKKLSFCGALFKGIWHGNKASPKVSSQNEIVPPLIVFHLPYSKYKGIKICFYSCRYQNQNFSLVSFVQHSCRSCSTHVALVLHSCCQCLTRVTIVALVLHSCRSCLALVL